MFVLGLVIEKENIVVLSLSLPTGESVYGMPVVLMSATVRSVSLSFRFELFLLPLLPTSFWKILKKSEN